MYLKTDVKHTLIRNNAYVFNIDVVDYWETVPGGYSLPSQIINIHANQTEIVGVDVGVAW